MLNIQGLVVMNLYTTHRHPDYFKNPTEFDPQRWLPLEEASESKAHSIEEEAWMPFGSGPRSCVGMRMALLEAKVILHQIFRKYSVEPVSEKQFDLETVTEPTLRPKTSLKLRFIPRIDNKVHF
jgi:cytochrome P450